MTCQYPVREIVAWKQSGNSLAGIVLRPNAPAEHLSLRTLGILLIAEIFYGTVAIFTQPLDPSRMAPPSIKNEGWSDIQDRAWLT